MSNTTVNNKVSILTNLFENFLQMNLLQVEASQRNKIMKKWEQFKCIFMEEEEETNQEQLKQISTTFVAQNQPTIKIHPNTTRNKINHHTKNTKTCPNFPPQNIQFSQQLYRQQFQGRSKFSPNLQMRQNSIFSSKNNSLLLNISRLTGGSNDYTQSFNSDSKQKQNIPKTIKTTQFTSLKKRDKSKKSRSTQDSEMEIIKKHFNRTKLISGAQKLITYMKQSELILFATSNIRHNKENKI